MAAEASGAWLTSGRARGETAERGSGAEEVSRAVVVQDNGAGRAARAGCGRVDARAMIGAGGTTVLASQGAGRGLSLAPVPT